MRWSKGAYASTGEKGTKGCVRMKEKAVQIRKTKKYFCLKRYYKKFTFKLNNKKMSY